MKRFFILFTFLLAIEAKIHVLEALTYNVTLPKNTKVYFMSNSDGEALKKITITAANSKINTNFFAYSVPREDGSVAPLLITADSDVLNVTKPDGVNAQLTLYYNENIPNLNIFPVSQSSSIRVKSGVNAFFKIDSSTEKILQVKNVKVDGNAKVVGYAGVPGDVTPYVFFDTSVYQENKFYRLLNVPRDNFYFDQIDSGVTYEVVLGVVGLNFEESGVLMTSGFPTGSMNRTDSIPSVVTNGGPVSLHVKPFFYSRIRYNTDIKVYFRGGAAQGNSFSSVGDAKLEAEGLISQVEILSQGSYSMQYYVSQKSTNPIQTTPSSSLQTTTKSSDSVNHGLLILSVFVSSLIL